MSTYIALIHEDKDGTYGVSFPDIPGLIAAGDTLEEAMEEAEEVLEFAAEDPDGSIGLKPPRTVDELRADPAFMAALQDAFVIEIELTPPDSNKFA